jgi:hypothetical protein
MRDADAGGLVRYWRQHRDPRLGTICGIIGSYPASTAPDPTGWEGASGFGTVVPRLLQW